MNNMYKIGIAVLLLVLSFASGRYLTPTKIQEKEVIKEVIKTEKEYITREIKKPDGTIINEVIISDKTETAKEETREKLVINDKPKYHLTYLPQYSFDNKKLYHGGTASMRVAGPVFVGLGYTTLNNTIQGVITIEL